MTIGLPGPYRARPYRGPEDHGPIAEVLAAHARGAGLSSVPTRQDIDNQYAHLTNSDPTTDMIIVEGDGRPVAYSRVEWWDVDDEKRVYAGLSRVHPDHHSLSPQLVSWFESRIDQIAASQPDTLPKYIWAWAEEPGEGEVAVGLTAALRSAGYRTLTYEAEMERPHLREVPDAPLPAGLEVRPVEERHLRTIWEAHQEAFRDHWGHSEPTEADYQRFLGFPHRDESLWQVAWDGDAVAGQVRTFINHAENEASGRNRGWTEFISTSRRWRRKGLARALICRSLRDLAERGLDEAALGVHVENPNGALGLYESLGYRRVALIGTYEKPID